MTFDRNSNNFIQSPKQSEKNNPFVVGADVIKYLNGVKHPIIMVDMIIHYDQISLIAERYVSANEPAFVGHFPNLKLWPGIYTIEGLRQSCYLLQILNDLEEMDLLKGVQELHKRHTLQPQIDHEACQRTIKYLKHIKITDQDIYSIRVKLLEPIFAGSLIRYHCFRDNINPRCFSVEAVVNERMVAKGEIIQFW